MKIISYQESEGRLKLAAQSLEDLWYLSRVVEPGDEAEGRSWRRFKSKGSERASSGEKKPVNVRLKLEAVEFAQNSNKLRLTGPILSGHPEEFVQLGEFHTLDVEIGAPIVLYKHLSPLHKKLLNEAKARSKHFKTAIVAIDDEKCIMGLLETTGLKIVFEAGNYASKRDPSSFESLTKKFYAEIIEGVKAQECKYLVIAGPGFERENFVKYLKEKSPELAKKTSTEHASSAEKPAILELLKKGLLEKIIGKQKLAQEFELLEKLKASLGRNDGMACYGEKEVGEAIEMNAVEKLLVIDEVVRKHKNISDLMQAADERGAEVVIFDSHDDAGKEMEDFKIAGLLRFKTKYA